MAPDLSPDGGTTTSTNSTSPALSSTLSESSSIMDVNLIQQQPMQPMQQPMQLQTPTTPTQIQPQQIQVVRTNQQSPGHQNKLPDQVLETNAYANKPEPSLSNNLLIMANEHKEFSCRVGDENVVNPSSNNQTVVVVDNKTPESDENATKAFDSDEKADDKDSSHAKNPNLSVASNIANAFINLSNLSSAPKHANGSVQAKNLNVIVTQQQIAQHFMKTLSFTTSRGGIFVPNVIATNITPQFTVHQYGLHGNPNGPAPNVTVNPNGNFASNSNAIRPGGQNHFRLLFQQSPNINLNIINNQGAVNTPPNPSPILEASLQTINKIAASQPAQSPAKTIIQNPIVNQKTTVSVAVQQKPNDEQAPESSSQPSDSPCVNNDQHIRVLTPSEIMKTLPSLSSQDNHCFNNGNMIAGDKNASAADNKSQAAFLHTSSDPSGSVATNSFKNSTNSSPLTITSECNTLSSNFVTTKATMSSNNAQTQMVSGYKTYKTIFLRKFGFRCVYFELSFDLTLSCRRLCSREKCAIRILRIFCVFPRDDRRQMVFVQFSFLHGMFLLLINSTPGDIR